MVIVAVEEIERYAQEVYDKATEQVGALSPGVLDVFRFTKALGGSIFKCSGGMKNYPRVTVDPEMVGFYVRYQSSRVMVVIGLARLIACTIIWWAMFLLGAHSWSFMSVATMGVMIVSLRPQRICLHWHC